MLNLFLTALPLLGNYLFSQKNKNSLNKPFKQIKNAMNKNYHN